MSRKKIKEFDSFGEVLIALMRGRGKNQAYLAHKTGKDPKQISNYVNKMTTPFNNTIQEIADALGIVIEITPDKKYKLFDPHSNDRPTIEEMIETYKDRKEKKDFSDTERDLLYEVLLDDAESLAANLHRLIEIEKNDSS